MRRPALVVAALGALATSSLPTSARADGVFSGRIGLTGFFYLESDGVDPTMDPMKKTATTANLAFGELRLTMNGLRMAKGRSTSASTPACA